jgi:hypothetical protein
MQVGAQKGIQLLQLANKLVFISARAVVELASYVNLVEHPSLEFDGVKTS